MTKAQIKKLLWLAYKVQDREFRLRVVGKLQNMESID